jgi:hypothetical protein
MFSNWNNIRVDIERGAFLQEEKCSFLFEVKKHPFGVLPTSIINLLRRYIYEASFS